MFVGEATDGDGVFVGDARVGTPGVRVATLQAIMTSTIKMRLVTFFIGAPVGKEPLTACVSAAAESSQAVRWKRLLGGVFDFEQFNQPVFSLLPVAI